MSIFEDIFSSFSLFSCNRENALQALVSDRNGMRISFAVQGLDKALNAVMETARLGWYIICIELYIFHDGACGVSKTFQFRADRFSPGSQLKNKISRWVLSAAFFCWCPRRGGSCSRYEWCSQTPCGVFDDESSERQRHRCALVQSTGAGIRAERTNCYHASSWVWSVLHVGNFFPSLCYCFPLDRSIST